VGYIEELYGKGLRCLCRMATVRTKQKFFCKVQSTAACIKSVDFVDGEGVVDFLKIML